PPPPLRCSPSSPQRPPERSTEDFRALSAAAGRALVRSPCVQNADRFLIPPVRRRTVSSQAQPNLGVAAVKIAVAGCGYVGLSIATLLAQHHEVVALDIDEEKVAAVNAGRSPIVDPELTEYLASGRLRLRATTSATEALGGSTFVVIATPTDYDPGSNYFDTSSVRSVLEQVDAVAPEAVVVIKSTVPVGFTAGMRAEHPDLQVLFSPEFLREGKALWDNLHPSRIVVGDRGEVGKQFADLLVEGSLETDVPVLLTDATEAEAIKLFANTYLALRVAYFNELDTFALTQGLDSAPLIEGVSMDPRHAST